MAFESPIQTCNTFQAGPTTATTWWPPTSATFNGGLGIQTPATSQTLGAQEVAIFGYLVTTVGTSIQFNVGSDATPTPIVGMLFTTTALGMVTFPNPVLIRAPAAALDTDASISITTTGTGVYTIFYRKLS